MRNAVQRRNHKERSQLPGREKWGILEKHKDYSLRAADYNVKKRKLSILSQKARDRHPDEFAFGMLSAEKSKQGKHGQNSVENRLGHDTVRLLKTQDAGYLRTVGQKGRREVEELERVVRKSEVLDAVGSDIAEDEDGDRVSKGKQAVGKKIKFVSDEDQMEPATTTKTTTESQQPPPEQDLSSDSDTQSQPSQPPKKKFKRASPLSDLRAIRKRRKRLRDIQAAKLQALKVRQKEIMAAAEALEQQRAKMTKGVGGVNKNGVAFKQRERKR